MPTGFNSLKVFEGVNVLIIGDLMLDAYWHGMVDRISPEAPVPVVNIDAKEYRLGGAGNVALNIKPFDAKPILCSVTGMDEHAEVLLEELKANGISSEGIVQSKSRPTTVKTRVWSKNQQLIRLDEESTADLDKPEEEQLLKRVAGILDNAKIDVIIFQDYNKGVLTKNLIQIILAEARKRDIPTVVDPKDNNFWAYKGVSLFKPNLSEVNHQMLSASLVYTIDDYDRMAAQIFSNLGIEKLLITLSDKGIYYNDQFSKGLIAAKIRYIADVCGAGDTVVSTAALGIAKGWPLEDIAMLSNLAGGIVCEGAGVVPIDPHRLAREYKALVAGL